jgi:hypothetical protein
VEQIFRHKALEFNGFVQEAEQFYFCPSVPVFHTAHQIRDKCYRIRLFALEIDALFAGRRTGESG